jgi:hypothetical protein
MAAESKLRKALKKRVEAYGGEIRAVSWLGRSNAPDVLCLFPFNCRHPIGWGEEAGVNMHHPFVETKGTRKVSDVQLREHERMRAAGCVVVLCRSLEELNAWLPPL